MVKTLREYMDANSTVMPDTQDKIKFWFDDTLDMDILDGINAIRDRINKDPLSQETVGFYTAILSFLLDIETHIVIEEKWQKLRKQLLNEAI